MQLNIGRWQETIYKDLLLLCVLFIYVQCQQDLPEGSPCTVGNFNGTCVNMKRCYSLIQDFVDKKRPTICSFQGKDPIICCTDCTLVDDINKIVLDPQRGPLLKTGKKAWDKCLDYINKLPYECKNHYTATLIKTWDREKKCHDVQYTSVGAAGGQDAKRDEYPHMALLGYGADLDTAQWLCGGSLISENFILTAAHCSSSAQLGSVTYAALGILKRTDPPELWKRYKVKQIILHPGYKAPSKYDDIALLETVKRVEFYKSVLPVCLSVAQPRESYAIATGWGALGHRRELADTLQEVILQPFSHEECSAIYRPHRHLKRGYDPATQMCFGDHGLPRDTCPGDSGGPLQYKTGCAYDIIGVTSVGRDCGFAGQPGMYTRVLNYTSWIENIVWP